MSILDNHYFNVLERSLNAATLRQRVIANNIANADVPNFKRSEVTFEEQLSAELSKQQPAFAAKRTDFRHIAFGSGGGHRAVASVVQDHTSSMNNNGNNVDIELEMANLAKTQLAYNYYIGQTNHEISMLRKAIGGRG